MLMRYLILMLSCCFYSSLAWADAPDDVLSAKKSVVRIYTLCTDAKGKSCGDFSGSGFVVGKGVVVTNYHVVSPPDSKKGSSFESYIADGGLFKGKLKRVEIIAQLPEQDLALLKVEALSERPALKVFVNDAENVSGQSPLKDGQDVYAIGFPGLGDEWSLEQILKQEASKNLKAADITAMEKDLTTPAQQEGEVSKITTTPASDWGVGGSTLESQAEPVNIIQHSARVNPGNSGGPLLDKCGNVVGVNTQVATNGINTVNKALDVTELLAFLDTNNVQYQKSTGSCDAASVAAISRSVSPAEQTDATSPRPVLWTLIGAGLVVTALAGFVMLMRKPFVTIHGDGQLNQEISPVRSALPGPTASFCLQGMHRLKSLSFPLDKGHIQIGSSASLNDYAVPDQTVSRHHIDLRNKDGQWQLVTAHATLNPTRLNGEVVPQNEARNLNEGDVLELGEANFKFSRA